MQKLRTVNADAQACAGVDIAGCK